MSIKKTLKYLGYVVLCAAILMGASCSNPFDEMNAKYKEGKYLEAAKHAVNGLKNEELKPQVMVFLEQNGLNLIEKAFFKGKRLLKSPSESTVNYFVALLRVLEEMILLDVPVEGLDGAVKDAEKYLQDAKDNYILAAYQDALEAYDGKLFQKSIRLIESIKKYTPSFRDSEVLRKRAETKAKRSIAITPFAKYADDITQAVGDFVFGAVTSGKKLGKMKLSLTLEGVNVPEEFNSKILYKLNQNKSRFMNFTLAELDQSVDNNNYYIDGAINAEVEERSYVVTVDNQLVNEYEYTVKVHVQSGVFLTNNDQEVQSISFSVEEQSRARYRGNISKSDVIRRAVEKAANKFSNTVLSVVDKDLDPYSYIIQVK